MLTDKEKRSLRNLAYFAISFKEKDGKPVTFTGNEFIVPSFEEMKQTAFDKILNLGFSKIQRVSPNEANCIIRLYRKVHYQYDDSTYNLYGVDFFALKSGKWVSDNNGRYKINFSYHLVKYWLDLGEPIDFECDFFDCYLRIR